MDYDRNKVDEMVLALLTLTMMKDDYGVRAWKGHDWDALDRLHTQGKRTKFPSGGVGAVGVKISVWLRLS